MIFKQNKFALFLQWSQPFHKNSIITVLRILLENLNFSTEFWKQDSKTQIRWESSNQSLHWNNRFLTIIIRPDWNFVCEKVDRTNENSGCLDFKKERVKVRRRHFRHHIFWNTILEYNSPLTFEWSEHDSVKSGSLRFLPVQYQQNKFQFERNPINLFEHNNWPVVSHYSIFDFRRTLVQVGWFWFRIGLLAEILRVFNFQKGTNNSRVIWNYSFGRMRF